MQSLDDYRNQIDDIDKKLVTLFEKRMDIVLNVAKFKKENNVEVLQNDREDEVLKNAVSNLSNHDYDNEAVKFLQAIMQISRGYQKKQISSFNDIARLNMQKAEMYKDSKAGFPGVPGSFSEEALIKFFGDKTQRISYEEFEDVFIALDKGEIDYGVLPIENSSTGAISLVLDLLKKYEFYIVGEDCIKIEQHLLGIKGTKLEDIKEVYSHPQGIEQSSEFLMQNKNWKLIPFHNTATSAKLVKDLNDKSKVAISGKRAADIYGLEIIKEKINNADDNNTRFAIISKKFFEPKDANKVSVVFSLENKVGTLYNLLSYFAENNINMIKIESRPMKDAPWKYLLYVDFDGSLKRLETGNALNLIEEKSEYFRLLGSYKKAVY